MSRYGVDVANQKDDPRHHQRLAAVRTPQNKFPAGSSDNEDNAEKQAKNLLSHTYALLSYEPVGRVADITDIYPATA